MNDALAFEPYNFEDGLKLKLQERYPESELLFHDVEKNNGVKYRALTITKLDCNISPTIYIDEYSRHYEETHDMDEICQQISEMYEKYGNVEFDIDSVVNFERVKTKICAKLINRVKNMSLLKYVPYREFLDLAVVYFISVEGIGNASVLIRDGLVDRWGVTEEELYSCAMQNTPLLFPENILPMSEVLKDMLSVEAMPEDAFAVIEDTIYVATNQSKIFGAAVLLYPRFLEHEAEALGRNFYIIPSSVHEVLIIPAEKIEQDADELLEMVKEVNTTQVSDEEVLSDNVYYYDREKNEVKALF